MDPDQGRLGRLRMAHNDGQVLDLSPAGIPNLTVVLESPDPLALVRAAVAKKLPRHSLADVSKAKRLMGYSPLVDFDEGFRRTVEYFKSSSKR